MRKMVIHFGPDSEGSGTQKHDVRDTDPAKQDYINQPEPAEEKGMWGDLLSRKFADKVRKAERVIDSITMGVGVWKQVKGMKRRNKIIAGAVVVAGVAGAAYLTMKSRERS
jgi:hypothetical protein